MRDGQREELRQRRKEILQELENLGRPSTGSPYIDKSKREQELTDELSEILHFLADDGQ